MEGLDNLHKIPFRNVKREVEVESLGSVSSGWAGFRCKGRNKAGRRTRRGGIGFALDFLCYGGGCRDWPRIVCLGACL